jgi:uncharacterized protein
MAMNMTGEVQLLTSRETVWAMLNKPAVLKSCIPGCESLDKDSDNEFRAVATIKIGPVKARWKGKVRFLNLDPPNSYRISGEGDGGSPGLPRAAPRSHSPTRMVEHCCPTTPEAQIGGKLAQLGQRLINSVAKKMPKQFQVPSGWPPKCVIIHRLVCCKGDAEGAKRNVTSMSVRDPRLDAGSRALSRTQPRAEHSRAHNHGRSVCSAVGLDVGNP